MRELFRRLADHADGSTGETLAEHHSVGASLDHRVDAFQDFVRRARDVGRKNDPPASAFVLLALDGLNRTAGTFIHQRVVEARIKILVFLHEKEQRAGRRFLHEPTDGVRRDAGGGFEDGAEGGGKSKTGVSPVPPP